MTDPTPIDRDIIQFLESDYSEEGIRIIDGAEQSYYRAGTTIFRSFLDI